jgi:hypothetical protein
MWELESGARRASRPPELLTTPSASSDSSKTSCLFMGEKPIEGTATWYYSSSGKMPSTCSLFSTMESFAPFQEHSSTMASCIKDLISFLPECQCVGTVLLISSILKKSCWAIQVIISLGLRISVLTIRCFGSGIFMLSCKVVSSYS